MLKRGVDIHEATHVLTLNGMIEKIVEKHGIGPKRELAPPSKGGFSVGMMEAQLYLKEVTGETVNNPEFEVHLLNEQGIEKARTLASLFDSLLDAVVAINPDKSREMHLVRTKLEEASFFAKKAMANQPENQKHK